MEVVVEGYRVVVSPSHWPSSCGRPGQLMGEKEKNVHQKTSAHCLINNSKCGSHDRCVLLLDGIRPTRDGQAINLKLASPEYTSTVSRASYRIKAMEPTELRQRVAQLTSRLREIE